MRILFRLLSPLLALGLAGLGLLVAIEVAWAARAPHRLLLPYPRLARQMRGAHWDDRLVLAVLAAITLLGLLLLVAQLLPHRSTLLELRPLSPRTDVALTRRGLRRLVRATVLGVAEVGSARTRLGRRRLRVRAVARRPGADGLDQRLLALVTSTLDQLALVRPLEVQVAVQRAKALPEAQARPAADGQAGSARQSAVEPPGPQQPR